MNEMADLVQRTERLQAHVDEVRKELAQLRQELARLQRDGNGAIPSGLSCLTVALSMAEDLGADFAAANPHDLAARGDEWFPKP